MEAKGPCLLWQSREGGPADMMAKGPQLSGEHLPTQKLSNSHSIAVKNRNVNPRYVTMYENETA